MSSLSISSNKNWVYEIKKKECKHISANFSFETENISVFGLDKEWIQTQMVYKNIKGDCVYVTGTCIYKNKIGEEALSEILLDFREDNISELKKQIKGIYTLFIYFSKNWYIFNDYYGIFNVFYALSTDNHFYISSNFSHFSISPMQIDIDPMQLMSEIIISTATDGRTWSKNINRLQGDEYIEIQGGNIECRLLSKKEYKVTYQYISYEKALEDLVRMQKENANLLNRLFKNIGLHITGGLDSRSVYAVSKLATNLDKKLNLNLYYGRGGITMPSCIEDEELVYKLAEKYGNKVNIFDWNDNPKDFSFDKKVNQKLFEKVGLHFMHYSGNKNFFSTYLDKKIQDCAPDFIEYGFFLEAIRLREWAEKKKGTYIDIDDYIDDYILKKAKGLFKKEYLDEFRDLMNSIVRKHIDKISIQCKDNKININDFEKLRWSISRQCDSRLGVYANQFAYSFPLFGTPEIHQLLLAMPAKEIAGSKFQMDFLRQMDSELINGDIPIFSHRRLFYIRNGKKVRVLSLKNIADIVFEVLPFLKKALQPLYQKNIYGNFTDVNKTIYNEILEKNQDIGNIIELSNHILPNDLMKIRQLVNIAYER